MQRVLEYPHSAEVSSFSFFSWIYLLTPWRGIQLSPLVVIIFTKNYTVKYIKKLNRYQIVVRKSMIISVAFHSWFYNLRFLFSTAWFRNQRIDHTFFFINVYRQKSFLHFCWLMRTFDGLYLLFLPEMMLKYDLYWHLPSHIQLQ